ncbi:MAG: carboxypeptidase-like regulatory domain-containing protein [Bacteroidetes bacterium]|nr:MAG: carboxypeptidase-like regulatory domain-containing protein [Bacteroidota bacterium]
MSGIRFIVISLIFLSHGWSLLAQEEKAEKLVQFSGIVVTADSIKPVPYANIMIEGSWRGTIADYYGYFSFVAKSNDTISFSAIGFKTGHFIIPDTITGSRYSLIQVMSNDTITLPQTVIYPWPTPEEFEQVFLTAEIPDDDYERAKKNLDMTKLRKIIREYPMDGSMNYKRSMQAHTDRLYYIGQTQPITILNPFAWAQFIKAWKEGKFKRKD